MEARAFGLLLKELADAIVDGEAAHTLPEERGTVGLPDLVDAARALLLGLSARCVGAVMGLRPTFGEM
eukprot:176591-Chlamydomonas_euryale.AAC.1